MNYRVKISYSALILAFMGIMSPKPLPAEEPPVVAAESENPVLLEEIGAYPSPPGVITPWSRFGEDYAEGLIDVLLPLYFDPDNGILLFTDFRGAYSDVSEQELNIGIGYRQLLESCDTLLGLNAFYDSRWTEDNSQFNQLGLGGEILTSWVDARANGYFPEKKREHLETVEETYLSGSTRSVSYNGYGAGNTIFERESTRTVNSFVQNSYSFYDVPLEGFDTELGVRLPLPGENFQARLFGGYYAFQPVWEGDLEGGNSIEGFKGRLELRFQDRFIIDAEVFEDDRLFGSDYLVSARVRLPFDISAISRGENPFRAHTQKTDTITSRFSEMVMRDPHIQIRQETGVVSESWKETRVSSRSYPVLENVIFVDGDNAGDTAENGTAEHPFDFIQEGVDSSAAQSLPNVFVYNAENPYVENIQVTNSINLYGGGARFGNGSAPGNGASPVVQSAGNAPFIFTFNGGGRALLTGFTLDGTSSGGGPVPVIGGGLFNNVPQVEVSQNFFRDLPIGVAGLYDNSLSGGFTMEVSGNRFERNLLAVGGLLGTSGDFLVTDNTIENSLLGIGVISTGSNMRPRTLIAGNSIHSDMPLNLFAFDAVDSLLGGFPVTLPDELPLPMLGGIVVGAVDSKLSAVIIDNSVQGPLLGITAFSLNLGASRTDLDLVIADNSVQGGGLAATLDLILDSGLLDSLLPGGLLPGSPGDFDPGFDAGLAGITTLSIGDGARINDALIVGNDVQNNLLGITTVAAGGGKAKRGIIADNLLINNALGITGLGIMGGNLSDLLIVENAVIGGGSRQVVSLLEGFTGPLPFEVPDFGLAGITLVGYNTDSMTDITVADNLVMDHAFGITALGLGDSNLKFLTVAGNDLEDNFSGVLLLGAGPDTNMSNALITENRISGAGTAFAADLLGGLLSTPVDFPDLGLAGVGVVGINGAKIKNFEISDNLITNQLIGVGAVGFGEANLKGGIVSDNTVEYGLAGIVGASVLDSNLNDLLIVNNELTGVGIDLPGGLPLGPLTLFNDKALAGIGVLAIDAKVKDITIVNNGITNNEFGIVGYELNGKIKNPTFGGNVFSDNTEDIILLP